MSMDPKRECGVIDLDSFAAGIPVISNNSAGYFMEACIVCLDSQGHGPGVILSVVTDNGRHCFELTWSHLVTDQLRRNFDGNHNKTTENGATAIALNLLLQIFEYAAIEEAFIGSTVDYFLVSNLDDTYIFNSIEAYCEIRGIRVEGPGNTVQGALAKKTRRLNTPEDLPTYIVIVEFGTPFARIAIR